MIIAGYILLNRNFESSTVCSKSYELILHSSNTVLDLAVTKDPGDHEPDLINEVFQLSDGDVPNYNCTPVTQGLAQRNPKAFHRLSIGLTLTISYSAIIGGVGTISGAIPNMIMKGAADE